MITDVIMNIPVLLTTYNRPKALKRTLLSLGRTAHYDIDLFIQDDGSDEEAYQVLKDQELWFPFRSVRLIGLAGRHGGEPNRSRRRILSYVFDTPYGEKVPFAVTIESDSVFHPEWLKKTVETYLSLPALKHGDKVATVSPYHGQMHAKKEERYPGYALRRATGGVCHLVSRQWYEIGKQERGWMAWNQRDKDTLDWPEGCGGWDNMMASQARELGLKFLCLVPSLVDHLSGDEGGTSGSRLWNDRAVDFLGEQYEHPEGSRS